VTEPCGGQEAVEHVTEFGIAAALFFKEGFQVRGRHWGGQTEKVLETFAFYVRQVCLDLAQRFGPLTRG
jgi:hypothetical protein